MQKSSVEPEIFPTFKHKVEWVPHFACVSKVRHINFIKNISILKNAILHCVNLNNIVFMIMVLLHSTLL